MIITDTVYGPQKIEEPLILELIATPEFERLGRLSQYGLPDRYYHMKNYSRREHSLGVFFLLRLLKAPVEEQVAGLLHDASHLAFSHVADWAFADGARGNEDTADEALLHFINTSRLAPILKKYSLEPKIVVANPAHLLLDRPLPDLCADRVDYALREFIYWLEPDHTPPFLSGITVKDGEMVFTDPLLAYRFATDFLHLQEWHWGGYESVARYYVSGNLFRKAVEKNICTREDFLGEEDAIFLKLINSSDPSIAEILHLLEQKPFPDIRGKTGEAVKKKFRHVDPKLYTGGEVKRLSEENKTYAVLLEQARKRNETGYVFQAPA